MSSACRKASDAKRPITIRPDNIEQLRASVPSYSAAEKLDNFLQLLCDKTSGVGQPASFSSQDDWPLTMLEPKHEMALFHRELSQRGLLDQTSTAAQMIVSLKGWERFEEIRRAGRSSSRAFVAMWFDPAMDEVWDKAIGLTIRDAGYEPLQIDKFDHVNRIDDEIIAQIKRSRFMVADFTGQRPGVYFEAGMMQGIGRNVIWMCRKKDLNDVHFDARQFNFIDYEIASEAKERLFNRILAIEGEGPLHGEPEPA